MCVCACVCLGRANDNFMAKPTEGESAPQYKKISYERRLSEARFLSDGLLKIKRMAQSELHRRTLHV